MNQVLQVILTVNALSKAIMNLEKSDGRDSLETLPEDQKAASVHATKLYEEIREAR
ncbi:MAG: hypothetical protein ABSA81_01515 [Candidatus Bathyarchaeia archaeon]